MNNLKRKRQESYIKLLSIFENELRHYHKKFDSDYYYLNYIIRCDSYTNDLGIRVTMNIIKKPLWLFRRYETRKLKGLLENFCRYFSINDVSLVRPYYKFQANGPTPVIKIPTIKERIAFEIFSDHSSWIPL